MNTAWFNLNSILLAAILLAQTIFVLPIFLLCFILRIVVKILSLIFCLDLEGFVSETPCIFAVQTSQFASVNILAGTTVKGYLDVNLERKRIEKLVFEHRNEKGELMYKKLKHTWRNFLGFAFWKEDRNFSIENHIRLFEYTDIRIETTGDHLDNASVANILQKLSTKPWDRKRSPWELLFYPFQSEGMNRTIIILRIDHVLIDVYGMIQLAKLVLGTECRTPVFRLGDKHFSAWDKIKMGARIAYDKAATMLTLLESPSIYYRKPLKHKQELIHSSSSSVSTEDIKLLKNRLNVDFATVVYSIINGAIAKALEASGQVAPNNVGLAYILPRNNHPGGLTVHANLMGTTLTLKCKDPIERVKKTQARFDAVRSSTFQYSAVFVFEMCQYLPTFLRQLVVSLYLGSGASVGVTQCPVMSGPTTYQGLEVVDTFGAVSTWGPIRIFVATFGASSQFRCIFSVDKSVFSSEEAAQNLGQYLDEEVEALKNAL